MAKLMAVAMVACLLVLYPSRSQGRGEVRLCGRMLAEALSLLCAGRYHGPPGDNRIGKREVAPSPRGPDSFPTWFLAVQQKIRDFQSHPGGRQERGVVDDCCRKACTPSTLLSYCGAITN